MHDGVFVRVFQFETELRKSSLKGEVTSKDLCEQACKTQWSSF